MEQDWGAFSDMFQHLVEKTYADGATKAQKRRIREKSQSFAVVNGILCHMYDTCIFVFTMFIMQPSRSL